MHVHLQSGYGQTDYIVQFVIALKKLADWGFPYIYIHLLSCIKQKIVRLECGTFYYPFFISIFLSIFIGRNAE